MRSNKESRIIFILFVLMYSPISAQEMFIDDEFEFADAQGLATRLPDATSKNVPNTLVKRNKNGNFSANNITANLRGLANSAKTFTQALTGDVTGGQSSTVVEFVGGQSASQVADTVLTVSARTALNEPLTIVTRDQEGNFSAGRITADLSGLATMAETFTQTLSGDVTGSQSSTVVEFVGGHSAADVGITVTTVMAASSGADPSTLVFRDSLGHTTISNLFVDELRSLSIPELIDESPFFGGGMITPNCMTISHNGKFLATTNPSNSTISMFTADLATGELTPIIGSPFTGAQLSSVTPQCLNFSDDDNFLAVTCTGTQSIVDIFSVDPLTGALDEVLSYTVTGSPYGLEYSSDGNFLVVVTQPNTVYIYFVDKESGSLMQIPNSPFDISINPYSLAITPNVEFLAVFDPVQELVTVIGGNPYTGVGAEIDGAPFFTGQVPRTVQKTPLLRTPTLPGFVRYSAGGNLLAVTNPNTDAAAYFSADLTTGALTSIDSSILLASPYGISFSPDGSELAIAERGSSPNGRVRIYTIDPASNFLIETARGGLDVGDIPYDVSFFPNGEYLAVMMPINSKIAIVDVAELITIDGSVAIDGNIEFEESSIYGGTIRIAGQTFLHGAGDDNTFVGHAAGNLFLSGARNVGIGSLVMQHITSGNNNIAIGYSAGDNLFTGTNNIYLAAPAGAFDEADVIRIGQDSTSCYISGINGATSASGVPVLVNSDGQLGTITSSEKYKKDIQVIDEYARRLLELAPVEFKYNEKLDPSGIQQFGLLAEEVAKVCPELVIFDEQGDPQTIRYHFLPPLELKLLQQQQIQLDALESVVAELRQEISKQSRVINN